VYLLTFPALQAKIYVSGFNFSHELALLQTSDFGTICIIFYL
jgi:hypothetical protein